MENLIYDLKKRENEFVIISDNDSNVYTYTYESELYSDLHNVKHDNEEDELKYELKHNDKTGYYPIKANELVQNLENEITRELYYSQIDLDNFVQKMEL